MAAFDSTGVPVRIVDRDGHVAFSLAGTSPREAHAIELLRSYATGSGLDPDELLGDGLAPAIVRIIDRDGAQGFPRRISRVLRGWSMRGRSRSTRSRRR